MADTIFHDPDDAWQYADLADIPYSRWPFGVPCPFIWNGAGWVRWYGSFDSPAEFKDDDIEWFSFIVDHRDAILRME